MFMTKKGNFWSMFHINLYNVNLKITLLIYSSNTQVNVLNKHTAPKRDRTDQLTDYNVFRIVFTWFAENVWGNVQANGIVHDSIRRGFGLSLS